MAALAFRIFCMDRGLGACSRQPAAAFAVGRQACAVQAAGGYGGTLAQALGNLGVRMSAILRKRNAARADRSNVKFHGKFKIFPN